jgi:ASPIC and UnbV
MMVRSRWAAGLAVGLLVTVLARVAWLLVGGRQVWEGLAGAEQRMAEGNHAGARDRLARSANWWPRDDQVAYLLGQCEAELARPEAVVTAWRIGGGSYLSASDPRLHFGLGTAMMADELEVRWPSGLVQRFGELAADRAYHLREGDDRPRDGGPTGKLQIRRSGFQPDARSVRVSG